MEPSLEAISLLSLEGWSSLLRCPGQDTIGMGHLPGEFLASKANKVGAGYHGQVGENEDDDMIVWCRLEREFASNGSGYNWPQDVDGGRGLARGAEADVEELQGMEAFPTALASWLDLDDAFGPRCIVLDIAIVNRELGALRGALFDGCVSCARLDSLAGGHGGQSRFEVVLAVELRHSMPALRPGSEGGYRGRLPRRRELAIGDWDNSSSCTVIASNKNQCQRRSIVVMTACWTTR